MFSRFAACSRIRAASALGTAEPGARAVLAERDRGRREMRADKMQQNVIIVFHIYALLLKIGSTDVSEQRKVGLEGKMTLS